MSKQTIYYRLRIRDAANTTDAIVITSVRGGTNPYLSTAPRGDGSSFDPLTCESMLGAYTGQIADWSIGGAQRVLTAQLEDGTTFRQQLGYRRAFVEWSYDGATWSGGVTGGVLIAGYLTLLRLVSAIEFEYTVSDPMSAQLVTQLFSPTSSMAITDFLATWPQRGCLLGGPIMAPKVGGKYGRVLGILDGGGWTMKVETTSLPGQYFLRPTWVYGPPVWSVSAQISGDLADAINNAIAPLQTAFSDGSQSPWTTIADTQIHYWAWSGVTLLIDAQDGAGFQPWKPLPYDYQAAADDAGNLKPATLVSPNKGNNGVGPGLKIIGDGTKTLTNGATVRVRAITVLPSETSPLYLTGHPIDLLTTFWTAANLAYDATACAALKAAWSGLPTQMSFRITEPRALADLVQAVCQPLGLGIRGNDAGELQPFIGRMMSATTPVVTVTSADVVDKSTSLPFELDPSKAVQTLTLSQKLFADQRNTPLGTRGSIVDGVSPVDDSATFVNGDTAAVPFGQLDIATDAQLGFQSATAPTIAQFGVAIAQGIFDRFGHGGIALETTLLRGGIGDSLHLGDQAIVNLPELPNHNYRLGENGSVSGRAMQIVRRTVLPQGYAVRFADSGPNAQPLGTVPVLTIAVSTDAPRTVALVTLTNAVALNALGYGARLQWAISTDGSVPAASAYADVQAWRAGQIPTTAFRLPPTAAGATVYVQARSEGVATARPSNYGAIVSVALSAVADPTGLTATPIATDGSQALLTWTPGANTGTDFIDVWYRPSGDPFSSATRVATLNAGSVQYTLTGLVLGSAYTATIQYRDPKTQDLSDLVEVTFTASGALVTLDPPTDATGFSGSRGANGVSQPGPEYGLAVAATVFPGFTEFTEEIETASNSGIYGAPVTVAKIPNVQGNWTLFENVAPNDGLRRVLAAREVRDGANPSDYTTGVVVTPWTSQPLGLFNQVVGSNGILRVSYTKSADGLSMDYTLTVGKSVTVVHIHTRTVTIDATGDVFDFSGDEDVTVEPGLVILRPDANDQVAFSIPLPQRGYEVAGRMVPYNGVKEGDSKPFTVFAAPPAVNAKLHPARTGAIGSLSIDLAWGPSDGDSTGVLVDVIQDSLTTSTTILSRKVATPGTIDSGTDAALGNIALPAGKDFLQFRVRIWDVSGQPWWFGPANISRDPLADATATLLNYRANPTAVIAFGPDTDSIQVVEHDGKTKTWDAAALALAGSPVQYQRGVTAMDDASTEAALTVDQTLSGFTVKAQGGGTWTTILGPVDLHGQPKNGPTGKSEAVPNTNGDAVNVFLTPDTQVAEKLFVHYRLGVTDTALEYVLCAGAADPTPLAVTAGTKIGPSNFFVRVDGVGSRVALLADIALTDDQITTHSWEAIGEDSGMPSPWLDVTLSLMAKPWLQSVDAKFDPATLELSAVIVAGARVQSATVLFADNETFAGATVATGDVTTGNQLILRKALSAAQLDKTWHVRATPWNAPGETGLDGDPQEATVIVPAVIGEPQISVSENAATQQTTITVAIDDPGHWLDLAWTNGTIAGALHAALQDRGVTNLVAANTHTLVGTLHTWTFVVQQDPLHTIDVKIYEHFVDGSAKLACSTAVDTNKVSDLAGNAIADNGTTASVVLLWDANTRIGAGCAQFSLDGGVTWTSLTVTSTLTSSFSVTRSSSVQSLRVQAQNALDGNWGNYKDLVVSADVSEGPIFSVSKQTSTPDASHDRILWSCSQGVAKLSTNGGVTFSTPPASPIDVVKPATGALPYIFQFASGGVSVTDAVDVLPKSADSVTPKLDVALGTPTSATQPVTVTASNPVGGAAPSVTVKCVGCTMTIAGTTYADGTTQTIASGTVVTGNRAATTTATAGQLEIVATIGNESERILVPVNPQIQTVPPITATFKQLTSTTGQIFWSCVSGVAQLSIDNGTASVPPASGFSVTLDSNTHTYLFTATGTSAAVAVSVPALATSGSGGVLGGTFGTLTNVLHAAGTPGTVDFGFPSSGFGAGVAFNLYVRDSQRFGDEVYHYWTTTAAGASAYTYTASGTISSSHADPSFVIGFYAEATVGTTIGPRSTECETTYNHP